MPMVAATVRSTKQQWNRPFKVIELSQEGRRIEAERSSISLYKENELGVSAVRVHLDVPVHRVLPYDFDFPRKRDRLPL